MSTDPNTSQEHLSAIVTHWDLLLHAHDKTPELARAAQEKLLHRYGGAIRRYLVGCLRNADQADEVYQEFAIKFIEGGLEGARPEKGRFRQYLKTVLFHLLADYHQRQKRLPASWQEGLTEPATTPSDSSEDELAFGEQWRAVLLAQAWSKLELDEASGGQPYFSLLSYRRDHPNSRSEAMAEVFTVRFKRPLSAMAIRQMLHRARERFADLLLQHVLSTLEDPSVDTLHEELIELRLMQYCQPALERYRLGAAT